MEKNWIHLVFGDLELCMNKYSCILMNNNSETKNTTSITIIIESPLDIFGHSLISMYQQKQPEDAWPPISKTEYINLALINQESKNFENKIMRVTIRKTLDDITFDKELINYEDIISEKQNCFVC